MSHFWKRCQVHNFTPNCTKYETIHTLLPEDFLENHVSKVKPAHFKTAKLLGSSIGSKQEITFSVMLIFPSAFKKVCNGNNLSTENRLNDDLAFFKSSSFQLVINPPLCQRLLTTVCLIHGGYTGFSSQDVQIWIQGQIKFFTQKSPAFLMCISLSLYICLWRKSAHVLETLNMYYRRKQVRRELEETVSGRKRRREGEREKSLHFFGTLVPHLLATLRWGNCGFHNPVKALLFFVPLSWLFVVCNCSFLCLNMTESINSLFGC